ncbi:MAG: TetR/AcrR family transcriptional regulator [Thermomicrobiales bacterium]|nr:TetR/AcrR family transcriptional regulator [Thermomicrobiales bacterium]
MDSSVPNRLSARRQQIVDAAWHTLETEGQEAVTMRRLAAELGIKAPSLYKHFPDKSAVEAALIDRGFHLWGEMGRRALVDPGDALTNVARAYRKLANEHPHVYRLVTEGTLDSARLSPGLEDWSGEPLGALFTDPDSARAFWAFMHGMAIMEIDRRFPPDADLDRAWSSGLDAFQKRRSQR